MANFNFYSLLLIVCCVASTIEAHSIPLAESSSASEREAKNLWLFPFQSIQPHSYGPQSRYGFGGRQINSPISPAIAQNGLGPFFGYFPNLLTQPCPDCPACTTEAPPTTTTPTPTTTQAPVVCPPPRPPATQDIKNCSVGSDSMYVAAFNGTIKLDVTKNSNGVDSKNCMYMIVATYPNTKVSMVCTTKPPAVNLVIMSSFKDSTGTTVPSGGNLGKTGETYTSVGNYMDVTLNNLPDATKNVQAECAFQSLP